MYNRYIPQNDGSYRRSRMPDHARPKESPAPQPCHRKQVPPTPACPEPKPPCRPTPTPSEHTSCSASQGIPISGFLNKLLPKDFDTGDLMILLLLLLMSGDCQEDQNWALLTLILYLFL